MKPPFHYLFRFRQIKVDENGEVAFIENEKAFENERPILAREAVFKHFENYIEVLLQSKQKKEYTSDKQARKDLEDFDQLDELNLSENQLFRALRTSVVGIYLVQAGELPHKEIFREYEFLDDPIHSISLVNEGMVKLDGMIESLHDEFRLYQHYSFDTKNYKTIVSFFGATAYSDGPDFGTYEILQTPFDWTGYNKPHEGHWEEMEDEMVAPVEGQEYADLIEKTKENKTLEYKASMIFSFVPNETGYETKKKIAKGICAFLNTKGGLLFIGVSDKREIVGLDHDYKLKPKDKDAQDFFKGEFDKMVTQFFDSKARHYLETKPLQINGKDVFLIKVFPAKEPIYIRTNERKEFYIRGEGSSIPLDIEQAFNYIRSNPNWRGYFDREAD